MNILIVPLFIGSELISRYIVASLGYANYFSMLFLLFILTNVVTSFLIFIQHWMDHPSLADPNRFTLLAGLPAALGGTLMHFFWSLFFSGPPTVALASVGTLLGCMFGKSVYYTIMN